MLNSDIIIALYYQVPVLLFIIIPNIWSYYYIIIPNTDGTEMGHKLYTSSPIEYKLNTNWTQIEHWLGKT